MSFFGGKKKDKSGGGVVKTLCQDIKNGTKYADNPSKQEKFVADIALNLKSVRGVFYGESVEAAEQLTSEILASDLLQLLFTNMALLPFETRKDLVVLFGNMLRRKVGNRLVTVEHLEREVVLLDILVLGYETPDIAVTCGQILRQCIEYENLAKHLLNSPHFFKFFEYIQAEESFDGASDAFSTFKVLLTKHKTMSAEFLEKNYATFFDHYAKLLHSNYVTRRQSLKLLGELLLDRANFNVMTRYISDEENLKQMMNLLRDKSRNIQFEAFHVFKVFVANPNKAKPILEILVKNKDKLIVFLEGFHNDKAEDEQFADEKAFLLKQIEQL